MQQQCKHLVEHVTDRELRHSSGDVMVLVFRMLDVSSKVDIGSGEVVVAQQQLQPAIRTFAACTFCQLAVNSIGKTPKVLTTKAQNQVLQTSMRA